MVYHAAPRRIAGNVAILACAVLATTAATAVPVAAQTVLPPAPLTIGWDAPTDPAYSAPTSYVFETFRETATGVVITTLEFAAPATSHQVPLSTLPSGPFMAALKAKNAAATSARSNAVGPFVVAGPPSIPTNFRVLPGPSARSARPASGEVADSTVTPTSAASILPTAP